MKFKFNKFTKGFYYRQQHLVGLDGFLDVNNFVIYKNAIESTKGYKFLPLNLVEAFVAATLEYPLAGRAVQSIFSYVKYEEENIKLGPADFDYIEYFGLSDSFEYTIGFLKPPADAEDADNYGLLYTCDKECNLVSQETTIGTSSIIGGIAVKVVDGSTKENASFYGLIYNPIDNTLKFGKWTNHTVETYDTILWSISATYPVGTKLRVTELAAGDFRIFVDDVQIQAISDTTINGNCFGMVKLSS